MGAEGGELIRGTLRYIYIFVRVQKSKRKGAFQIKLALDTVHFHALQRCAHIYDAV